ncbi:ATP-binding cassette domain-containing protein, partial [Staphylococcus capitis]|nr:ATP-binding cassette domain-containing protein [Staphylococcus capitis]
MRSVTKRYGTAAAPITALDSLDLEVHAAPVFALLGPNGAGKTTTVELCEGFLHPDEGTVEVLGMDPVAKNSAVRSRIGVMLQ